MKDSNHYWPTTLKHAENKTMTWEVPKLHQMQGKVSWAEMTQQLNLRSHFIIHQKCWFQTCFTLTVFISYSPWRIQSSSLSSCLSDRNSSAAGQGQPPSFLLNKWPLPSFLHRNSPQGCSISNPKSTPIHLYPGASLVRSDSSLQNQVTARLKCTLLRQFPQLEVSWRIKKSRSRVRRPGLNGQS